MLLAPSGALYISMRHYFIKFHLAHATVGEQSLRIAYTSIESMEVKGAHTIIK